MLNPLLFAVLSLCPQGQVPDPPQATPAPVPGEDRFQVDFGKDGETGAFRVWFDRRGASIFSVQLLDHYVDVHAKRKETHDSGDYLLLVYGGKVQSLPITQAADGAQLFPQLGGGKQYPIWEHTTLPDGSVQFTLDNQKGLQLVKTFRWQQGKREIDLELQLRAGADSQAAAGTLKLVMQGLMLTNSQEVSLFGNPAVGIVTTADDERTVFHPKLGTVQDKVIAGKELSMAGSTDRFFGGFLYPRDAVARTAVRRVAFDSLPAAADQLTKTDAGTAPLLTYDLELPIPVAGNSTVATFGIYLGPKSQHVFAEDPDHVRFQPILDVDLDPPCCIAIPLGKQIAALLITLLGWFHSVVGNWGIAIMMLTILVRGCLSPLNYHMQKSMRAYGAKMAVVQPKLKALQEKYKDNKPKLQQEMVAFQREHKLLPPLGGCLPVFLTMPIYVGLFTALRTAYDLRQQPFLPVWITDLSQPDALASLPFWPHYLNLMPLLWIALLVRMQLRMPLPTDPQQRQTQQIMRYMPIAFGLMLYNYASGLMLYMVTSMLWSMIETAVFRKKFGPMDPNAAGMMPTPIM